MEPSVNLICNGYASLRKHSGNKVIRNWSAKICTLTSCIIFFVASCDSEPQVLDSKSARIADTVQHWVIEQSWPDELDSVPDNIKTRKIKTPESFLAMFEKSEFSAPDSILITSYFRKHSDTALSEYKLDKFQFMDIHFYTGDTIDRFPSNHKTFISFAKYFYDCPYNFVRGYANFSNEEICFIFGEGGWTHKERFIYSCNGYVRISQQGHSVSENKIFWNKKLLDSSECQVSYY